ncbi:hypothetical protein JYK14_22095 [Siccirubricoccus sp. KC 17139]|uniref:Uncharacterized protein n=1 Tax=Siccirubricoccus soli TaxID=2899147 RepID=A0ABT1DD10_9PROT|nr:hypothetical protein [Siccirubricoccus soli]MCO6418830.1 hypothetical protein [Siccirubricoccus soli]MCP2684965.1 hypothetical protein [Siccirubricoccus soli]
MHGRAEPPPQQPWLLSPEGEPGASPAALGLAPHGAGARPVPDDFSACSATLPVRHAVAAVLLALLVVAMGRSGPILDAAYGLDTLPGTEALITAAEAWHGAMQTLGIPQTLDALHGAFGLAE